MESDNTTAFCYWTVVVGVGCLLLAFWTYVKRSGRGARGKSVCCSKHLHSHEKNQSREQKSDLLTSLETRRREARDNGDGNGVCGLTTDEPLIDGQAAGRGADWPRPQVARNIRVEQSSSVSLFGLLELPHQPYTHQQQTTEREVTEQGESKGQSAGNKETRLLANQVEGQASEARNRETVVREEAMRLLADDQGTAGGPASSCQLDKETSRDDRDNNSCSAVNTIGCGFDCKLNSSNPYKMVVSASNHLAQGATSTGSHAFNQKGLQRRRKWLDRYTTSLSVYRGKRSVEEDGREGNVLDVQSEAVEQLEVGSGLHNTTSCYGCYGDVTHCGHSIVNTNVNEEDGTTQSPCFLVAENIATPDSDRFIGELDHLLEDAATGGDQGFLADLQPCIMQKSEQEPVKVHFQSPAVNRCQSFDDFEFLSAHSSPRF